MIEQRARVDRVEGETVWIQTEPQTGCHSCSAKNGCGSALIAQLFPARSHQQLSLPLGKDVAPRPGDRVVLGIEESYLQRVSLMLYALPLAGLLLGAIAGQFLTGTEPGAVLAGLSGLGVSLLWLRRKAGHMAGAGSSAIRILRVEHPRVSVPLGSLNP